jgi:predicted RecB family nuclease
MLATDWKKYITTWRDLLDEKKFRHGVGAISASAIGEQYYCEMKVEQSYLHEEIKTEQKEEGDALHDAIFAMKKTSFDELAKQIQSGRQCVVAFPLVAKHGEMTLIGQPDAVVFQGRRPIYLIELKTTRGATTIVYDGQRAQANTYGYLLDQIGFDCSVLKLIVVKLRQAEGLSGKQKSKFLPFLMRVLASGEDLSNVAKHSKEDVVIHTFPYERQTAVGDFQRVGGYWLGKREPIPATNPNKCRACEFARLCPSSLVSTSKGS